MTIRSGGHPRDPRQPRAPHARPYEADAYADADYAGDYRVDPYGPRRRDGRRGDGGGGVWGIVKFLAFTLVLAAVVLGVGLTVLRPVVNSAVLGWAADNPSALNLPFVADIVREDLGPDLTDAASSDPEQVPFTVETGDTAATIGSRLEEEGLIRDGRAFVFIAHDRALSTSLQAGDYLLRRNQTPDEMVSALLAPPAIPVVAIDLRPGLRLEQITAKLQTVDGLEMDVQEFYELVKHPPAELIADYPWLRTALADAPEGASLEGFLWPGAYRVLPDTTADEFVHKLLDGFAINVGDRMTVPKERGLTFYQVLTLASIVQKEAALDDERPIIAGVYQNRVDGLIDTRLLNADPTVIYGVDTLALDALPFEDWQRYSFWEIPDEPLASIEFPEGLVGFNTYTQPGLPPGPIATPNLASIDAALRPDTEDKYLYFVAIPDGGGAHAFAKTYKAHQKNLEKYGYT